MSHDRFDSTYYTGPDYNWAIPLASTTLSRVPNLPIGIAEARALPGPSFSYKFIHPNEVRKAYTADAHNFMEFIRANHADHIVAIGKPYIDYPLYFGEHDNLENSPWETYAGMPNIQWMYDPDTQRIYISKKTDNRYHLQVFAAEKDEFKLFHEARILHIDVKANKPIQLHTTLDNRKQIQEFLENVINNQETKSTLLNHCKEGIGHSAVFLLVELMLLLNCANPPIKELEPLRKELSTPGLTSNRYLAKLLSWAHRNIRSGLLSQPNNTSDDKYSANVVLLNDLLSTVNRWQLHVPESPVPEIKSISSSPSIPFKKLEVLKAEEEVKPILIHARQLFAERAKKEDQVYQWMLARRSETEQVNYKNLLNVPWLLFYGPIKFLKSLMKICKGKKIGRHLIRLAFATGGAIEGALWGSTIFSAVGAGIGGMIGGLMGINIITALVNSFKNWYNKEFIEYEYKIESPGHKVRLLPLKSKSTYSLLINEGLSLIERLEGSRQRTKNDCCGTLPFSAQGQRLQAQKELQHLIANKTNPYTDPSTQRTLLPLFEPHPLHTRRDFLSEDEGYVLEYLKQHTH
jgi:hypothetical protein